MLFRSLPHASAHARDVLARPRLSVVPITIGDARRFVEAHHSHHHAPLGGLFAAAVAAGDRVVCVAVVSRPVARKLGGRGIAEVTRSASDGTPHAASMCIAAATRAALALGYRRVISYTLAGEAGTSYRAAGWHITGSTHNADGWGTREGRVTVQSGAKFRWETGPDAMPLDVEATAECARLVGVAEVPARPETLPLLRGATAAGWAALVVGEAAVRAVGGEPAGRGEIERRAAGRRKRT